MKACRNIFFNFLQWRVLLFILSVFLLLTGCDQKHQAPRQQHISDVSTVTIQPEKVILTSELPGRTSAYAIAEIRPQVSGIIEKRMFEEGADVKAGQVLYQIDSALYQAAFDQVEANHLAMKKAVDRARAALEASSADVRRLQASLGLARKNRTRYEHSFEDKIVSAVQRDQSVTEVQVLESSLSAAKAQVESNHSAVAAAKASVKEAEAALKTARINLAYCRVTAPIAGRIGRSNVTEGATVTAYQPVPLATIQQLDPIYADIPQSTAELLRLKHSGLNRKLEGLDKVKLILEDSSEYPLEGTLKFSDITVDPTTGSVILRVVFPNPDHVLLPGMFVRTKIIEGVRDQALLVPQQGVSRDHKGNPFALIVNAESKVESRMLTLDRALGDQWLILDGLAPNDHVIVEGTQMLRPGMSVNARQIDLNQKGSGSSVSPNRQSDHQRNGGV